jgi:hypothetical protein
MEKIERGKTSSMENKNRNQEQLVRSRMQDWDGKRAPKSNDLSWA